jgi:hypothetical protein
VSRPSTRPRIDTELGTEILCSKCLEYWPEDKEFFFFSQGKAHSWCKDCYCNDPKMVAKKERWLTKQRKNPAAQAVAEVMP